ncbi:hypothetical protein [Streptomyces sp. NPDC015125]|uniref:hypothetical protein n=1 Tax=Streptomyces sp. NPDC015125 TaxID=3364938 RepID=UPI0036F5EA5A
MTTDHDAVRRSQLPPIPPAEWDHHTWYPTPDGGGDLVPGQHSRGVLIRRRVTWGDWEPVHPAHWAPEPERDANASRPAENCSDAGRGDLFRHTAEEACEAMQDMGFELYKAQDAIAYAQEMCAIRDRNQQADPGGGTATTAEFLTWLDGPKCGRQMLLGPGDRSALGPRAGDPSAAGHGPENPSDGGAS